LVEGVDRIVGVAVDNSDEGRRARIVEGHHHVVVHLTRLALDFDLEDALQLDISACLPVLGYVERCILNMRMSGVKKG
jgi:hypothetical protein